MTFFAFANSNFCQVNKNHSLWFEKKYSHACRVVLLSNYSCCMLIQGPLKIWIEHSNLPLQGRGDTKTPIALLRSNIFFKKKCESNFPKHIKAEGMIKFNIFHILAENSMNSVICAFWAAKIWNSSNNSHVRAG